jgi:hypothetical protein
MSEAFEDALGVYVGPATFEEALGVLRDDTRAMGEWILQIENTEGQAIREIHLVNEYLVENDDRAVWFAVLEEAADPAGNPAIYEPVETLILVFLKDERLGRMAKFSVYSGGLVIEPLFGRFAGHKLRLAVWHSVMHKTESGDLAPGLGGFDVERDGDEES